MNAGSKSFATRCFLLDVSRCRVPQMHRLRGVIDTIASLQFNQLQLYTEHTFAYSLHETVWRDASPIAPAEIRELDRYAGARGIELVPNQNCFGHMDRWLRHSGYRDLAETPDGFDFPWGIRCPTGFTLNPLDPRSLDLVTGLLEELTPHFASAQVNVGCDETFDLGMGKSKLECERSGKAQVYLQFLLKIQSACERLGKRMQYWGDVVLNHPEVIAQLPKSAIALNWGYEANHPFDVEGAKFRAAGLEYYVCPGTSSWLSIVGRWDNMVANCRAAAVAGRKHGATGYLLTDWGDLGHLQQEVFSIPGMVAGSQCAVDVESFSENDLARRVSELLEDPSGNLGDALKVMGNTYTRMEPLHTWSRLFAALIGDEQRLPLYSSVTVEQFRTVLADCDHAEALLASVTSPSARQWAEQVQQGVRMVRCACWRGLRRLAASPLSDSQLDETWGAMIAQQRRLWHTTDRPGGLEESIARLEAPQTAWR